MERIILWKAGIRRHKGSLAGIFILIFLVSLILATVLAVWTNAGAYIQAETDRAGFGDVTVWVSGAPDMDALQDSIVSLDEVGRVERQSLIFAQYEVNGQESDSEGQMIAWSHGEERYRFFNDSLSGYRKAPEEIRPGEVYVSPAMVSMMNVHAGDEIAFSVARSGVEIKLTVAGYYEDPFMGSAMIGMKGFLVSEKDQEAVRQILRENKMEALAREGAMLHVFTEEESGAGAAQLNVRLNESAGLPEYTEFIHSKSAIMQFMLILQNAFGGLFLAFALVLLCISLLILGHSIQAVTEQEYVNFGILKAVGMPAAGLAGIQLFEYLPVIVSAMLLGFFMSVPVAGLVNRGTVTATGILVPEDPPVLLWIVCFAGMTALLTAFLRLKLNKIKYVTPMKAIRGEVSQPGVNPKRMSVVDGRWLEAGLAVRQLVSAKHKYVSAGVVAALLVFFASLAGRMDSWLGPDGKGMMAAFNPADHDIGVQTLGQLTGEEAEEMILSCTDITDSYQLAMQEVSVNGVNYTANVITEPGRFHIIRGHTSAADDEILLTEPVARDMGVSIGDTVTVRGEEGAGNYTVCGIYQCANDMGNNIGMSREGYLKIGKEDEHMWCSHYFLADPSVKPHLMQNLEDAYGGDIHVHENSWPGLAGIISAMQALLIFLYAIAGFIVLIVTVMTGSKILGAERRDMGIYKSLGFSAARLRAAFALRFGMTAVIGSAAGTVLAAILTDPVVSSVMKLAGISNFSSSPPAAVVLLPGVSVSALFVLTAYLAAGSIKRLDMAVLTAE